MKKLPVLTALLLTLSIMTLTASAQTAVAPAATPMADLMRSEGRIYVVIAVMLTILTGLFLYLIRLDRKISNLEKE